MQRFNFTQDRVRKLQPPTTGRDVYHDTGQPKLSLRVTPTGARSFQVAKKTTDGRTRRITLGSWPDVSVAQARDLARKALRDLAEGRDVNAEKRKAKAAAAPLGDLLERYIKNRDLKPGTVADYRKKFAEGFEDWRMRPVSKITPNMVLRRQRELTKRGPTLANTTMRVLRAVLRYAKATGAVETVATDILSEARTWHPNKRKDRIIPADSLQDWYRAVLNLEHPKAKVYLLTLLHTGLRRSEAEGLLWADVDLKGKTLKIRNTKNKTDHELPIPEALQAHLRALGAETGATPWVFPNRDASGPMSTPSKHIQRVIQESGVAFSPHDCRRTFATIAEAVGLSQTIIKRLLNHTTDNDVTGGYIRTELDTLGESINRIGDFITTKALQADNVVPLAKRG